MTTLKDLVMSEIADFFATFGSPSQPLNAQHAAALLSQRLDVCFATIPAQPVIPEQRQMVPDEIMPGGLVYSSPLTRFESNDSDKVAGYHCLVHGKTRSVMNQEQAYSDAMLVVEACRAAFVSTAQPVSKPYKLPVGYFSYGTEHGFNWHTTAKQATDDAEAMIDDYRGDACDGWSEETDDVCWGVILQQAGKVDERPRTDDDANINPHIDTVCDYALLPAQESEND